MRIDEIDAILRRSFDDRRLSRGETRALREVFADALRDSASRHHARQAAFAIFKETLRDARDGEALEWLESVVKLLDSPENERTTPRAEAFFSPGEHCVQAIIGHLARARDTIDICVFTVTDDRISDAILGAKGRGVRVRLITDDDKSLDLGSDIDRFVRGGIDVALDPDPSHMHHKFAIFDSETLLTGSYNWTRSAASENRDNVLVTNDPRLVAAFTREFEKLWAEFKRG